MPFRIVSRTFDLIRRGLGDFDFRADLARLDGANTLVIHGDRDPIDVSYARETARLSGARLEVLPGCGHVPYVEAPERFFSILRGFLGGLS